VPPRPASVVERALSCAERLTHSGGIVRRIEARITVAVETTVSNTSSAVRSESTNSRTELVCSPSTSSVPTFAELYSTYFRFVWSTARYLRVDTAELDDVVHDVFVIIYERYHTLERPESLRSWIYGVVRRVASTYHRGKRTALIRAETARLEPEMMSAKVNTPQQLVEESEQAKLLWKLLEKLDATKRETFVLAELEGMTAPEIAAATNVPLNTVYSRLRVARQEMEEALQRLRARPALRGQSCPNWVAAV